jgi:exonuclease VII large subunit
VLDRGYSIVSTAAGQIVQDAALLRAGDQLALRFARGSAEAAVVRTRDDDAAR